MRNVSRPPLAPLATLTLRSALRRPDNPSSSSSQGRFSFQAPPETASAESALSYGVENPIPPLPAPELADQYFELVYSHVQAQYGFLDWHALKAWHQNREQICLNRPVVGSGQGPDHARGLAAFLLWLVYGYGARLMEERKIEGAVSHEVSQLCLPPPRRTAQADTLRYTTLPLLPVCPPSHLTTHSPPYSVSCCSRRILSGMPVPKSVLGK